jgi:predicted dehydrogenase
MTDRYPVCVWGVGPAGGNYLRSLLKSHKLDVVAFANRSQERREKIARETKVPGYANLAELLEESERKPRMVVISTANPTHKDFTIEALEAGLDVFLDKPMGQDIAEAKAILEVAERASGQLQVGFEYRYGTMTARLKELQTLGHFGDLTSVDITDSRGHWWPDSPDTPVEKVWRLNPDIGGGPLLHCGIHELDLMRYYGGEIERIQAFVPPTSIGFYPDGIPDHLVIQARFASGASGSFTLYHNIAPTWYRPMPPHQPNYHAVPGHGLDLVLTGRQGSAIAEIYKEALHLNHFDVDNRETVYLRTETFEHHHPNVSHHNTSKMIVDVACRFADGLGPIDDANDAYKTTVLGHICEEAVQAAITDGWTSGPVSL